MPYSPAFPSAAAEYVLPRFENNEMFIYVYIQFD